MKVVLFYYGLGMRLYPTTERLPKPLFLVGDKFLLRQQLFSLLCKVNWY
jgi:NDP-sugar pyrophosphorylase family protein